MEIGLDAEEDGLVEVGGEAGGAEEIECKLFGDGGGGRGDDVVAGGFRDGGDVASGGGLLKRLEEGA